MFSKKRCPKCGEKVNDSYSYCPYCRNSLKDSDDDEDWGILGKNDFMEPGDIKLPMGLNSLFNSLVKNLNLQMKELENGKNVNNAPLMGAMGENIQEVSEKPKVKLPSSDSRKFSDLPKKEPETNIRRFSNKVVYEIKLPGVKTIKDISIAQLENSIEIKALAGKKVFYKVIPISLPINRYNLSGGILTLELDSNE